jgi:hypothetical protein
MAAGSIRFNLRRGEIVRVAIAREVTREADFRRTPKSGARSARRGVQIVTRSEIATALAQKNLASREFRDRPKTGTQSIAHYRSTRGMYTAQWDRWNHSDHASSTTTRLYLSENPLQISGETVM